MSPQRPGSRLVFVRHGQTDYNIGGRVQGQIDIALNDVGRKQAEVMGPYVAEYEPTLIVSSDLSRAWDTASEIARHTSCELVSDERIRERAFGQLEGLSIDELTRDFAEEYRVWKDTGECPKAGVESRAAVGERFVAAIAERVSHETGTYVFVSHGSAIVQAITHLLGLEPSAWNGFRGPNNCHWSVVDQANRPPYWRVIAHNLGVGGIDEGASRG